MIPSGMTTDDFCGGAARLFYFATGKNRSERHRPPTARLLPVPRRDFGISLKDSWSKRYTSVADRQRGRFDAYANGLGRPPVVFGIGIGPGSTTRNNPESIRTTRNTFDQSIRPA
jgi:hypothetical protein